MPGLGSLAPLGICEDIFEDSVMSMRDTVAIDELTWNSPGTYLERQFKVQL